MGVAVNFRGRLDDFSRLEPLEDRVVDIAIALGGSVRIWRSTSGKNPDRSVRGVIWDVAPGCETFALLFSPEGWLVPLFAIQAAEDGELDEQPWVSVKTQFAKPEAHIAIVETLRAIRDRYLPDLEVEDEGGYWETRDLAELLRRRRLLDAALDKVTEALENATPHPHAADDAGILMAGIETIVEEVHKTLHGPSEHPPARFAGDDNPWSDEKGTEEEWDATYPEQRRKQERMHRRIEEAIGRGMDPGDALDSAIEAEGIGLSDPFREEEAGEEFEPNGSPLGFEGEPEEPEAWSTEASSFEEEGEERKHPLQEMSMELMVRVTKLRRDRPADLPDPLLDVQGGLGDVMGGLAQALCSHGLDEEDGLDTGWNLVQLKRALRGAAFARGALFRAKHEKRLNREEFDAFQSTLQSLEKDVLIQIGVARSKL
jgi:hypothetical protein